MATKLLTNPVVKYFLEAKEELKKVTWPSRKDTTRYSIAIFLFCAVLALFFGAFDWILNMGIQYLLDLTA